MNSFLIGKVSGGETGERKPVLVDSEGHLLTRPAAMAQTSAGFTRPANVTAYAANDVVADGTVEQSYLAALQAGAGGYVVGVLVSTSQTTCTARLRLHLFKDTQLDGDYEVDNDPFALVSVDAQNNYLGYIDLPALASPGTGSEVAIAQTSDCRLPVVPEATDTSLKGVLQTLDAFTPASGQTFRIQLTIDQN